MAKYISLLRGINVGGHKKIKMDQLKTCYKSLGFKNVITYIQSGNVIFEVDESDPNKLVNLIENKIEKTFGFSVTVLIRTKSEFQKILENNPFLGERKEDISKLHVTFLSEAPIDHSLEPIEKFRDKSEELILSGKEIYIFFPKGLGRTKLSNNVMEKKLKISATTRNLKTINKLYDLVNTKML